MVATRMAPGALQCNLRKKIARRAFFASRSRDTCDLIRFKSLLHMQRFASLIADGNAR
jgi:hypothetical protein